MFFKRVDKQCIFFINEEMELLNAAISLLLGGRNKEKVINIIGKEKEDYFNRKYRYLIEVLKSLNFNLAMSIFELLQVDMLESFTLNRFRDFLLDLSREELLSRFFDLEQEKIEIVFQNEGDFTFFYNEHKEFFENYLGAQTFVFNVKQMIDELFKVALEIKCDAFHEEFNSNKERYQNELNRLEDALTKMDPLEYSQELFGKIFGRRGPYQYFAFIPSFFIPFKIVRFMSENQILFYSLVEKKLEEKEVLEKLKVLADDTRFHIIMLLKKKAPLRGMDIANELKLAPSTVSHHLEALKNIGLIHEERTKNSKLYSINTKQTKEILSMLERYLEIN